HRIAHQKRRVRTGPEKKFRTRFQRRYTRSPPFGGLARRKSRTRTRHPPSEEAFMKRVASNCPSSCWPGSGAVCSRSTWLSRRAASRATLGGRSTGAAPGGCCPRSCRKPRPERRRHSTRVIRLFAPAGTKKEDNSMAEKIGETLRQGGV